MSLRKKKNNKKNQNQQGFYTASKTATKNQMVPRGQEVIKTFTKNVSVFLSHKLVIHSGIVFVLKDKHINEKIW